MKSIEEVVDKFHKKGYKITPQRRAIFAILFENENHPRAEDIFKKLKIQMPNLSRNTIYNTLNELRDLGLIDTVHSIGEESARFDPNTARHHHLYCVQCRKIIDIKLDLDNIKLPDEETKGFQIEKNQMTFFGYCADCKKE